jgi:hypothetical protein
MPIRTNRGRGAVYRRLWGWPLRSPRHLVVSLVVLGAVIVTIAVVSQRVGPHRPASTFTGMSSDQIVPPVLTSGALASGSPTVSAAPRTRLATPPETPSSAPPASAALDVITAWGKAWVNHPVGMTSDQWLAQLAPYTSEELLPQMRSISLDNVGATQVTGAPNVVHSYTDSVEALLPTNGGTIDVRAVATPTGWQVNYYNPGAGP